MPAQLSRRGMAIIVRDMAWRWACAGATYEQLMAAHGWAGEDVRRLIADYVIAALRVDRLPVDDETMRALTRKAIEKSDRYLRKAEALVDQQNNTRLAVMVAEERAQREAARIKSEADVAARRIEAETRERERQERAARSIAASSHPNPVPRCLVFRSRQTRLAWIIEKHREGATLAAIGRMLGIGRERVRGLYEQGEREVAAASKLHPRQHLSRPLDMGGPRDVWLEFYVPPDPRFDNMVPAGRE